MLRLIVTAAIALLSTSAFSITQKEIDDAVLPLIAEAKKLCDRNVEYEYEVKDINKDGVDEIILTMSDGFCFGMAGSRILLLIQDGNGKWRAEFDFPATVFKLIDRTDSNWPDFEFHGRGFCAPIWRHDGQKYEIYRMCEDGKLVNVKPDRTPKSPASTIRNLVPMKMHDGDIDGPPYDHNGSIVTIDADRGLIVYDRPKKAIAGTVKPGTILFEGKPWGHISTDDAVIRGTAYVFKKGCPAAGYEVRGMYHHAYGFNHITLEGVAPVRKKDSCDIIGDTIKGPHTKLEFEIATY